MTAPSSCSVIIRCFNEAKHLGQLLHGIEHQTISDVEIVIVDSGSTDATLEIAEEYGAKVVHIKPGDFTFGRSLNLGCAAASHAHLVIASGHVYPPYETWLEHMLAPFADPDVALVYGRQKGDSRTRFSESQIFEKWFPRESASNQTTPFCNNANSAVRKDVWESIPYNENLTGLEDLDWAKRAMSEGHKIAYSAGAEVIHVHQETFRQVLNRYKREAIALKQVMPNQRFGLMDFLRLSIRNTFSDYYHSIRDKKFLHGLIDIPVFRTMQFWGTYRGFAQHGPVTHELRQRFFYPRTKGESVDELEKFDSLGKRVNY